MVEAKRTRRAHCDFVYKRDDGICQLCKADTKPVAILLVQLQTSWQTARTFYVKSKGAFYIVPDPAIVSQLKTAARVVMDEFRAFPDLYCWDKINTGTMILDPNNMGFPRLIRQHAHEIDHIIPFSQGGATEPENLWLLCIKCHQQRTKTLTMKRVYVNAKKRRKAEKVARIQLREKYKR